METGKKEYGSMKKNMMAANLSRLFVMTAMGLIGPAFSATFTEDFETGTLGEKYTKVTGQWSVADGQLTGNNGTKSSTLLLTEPTIGKGALTVTADFMIENPKAEKAAIGVFVGHEEANVYSMVRFRGGASNVMQLIAMMGEKDKIAALPPGEPLKAGAWYRLTVKSAKKGRYDITLVERDAPGRKVASGSLSGPVQADTGKIGFYISGSSGRFDNFSFTAE